MLGFLQRLGKALMLPIAVLPAAGLLLRLGQPDLLNVPFIAAAGDAVFSNLALIFAIGVAIGFSKDGNGAAALAGAIGYFVLTKGAAAIDKDINMSVLGGIISGVIAGLLYNRYHDIKLPDWLGFFGGRRFVPIVTSLVMLVLALSFWLCMAADSRWHQRGRPLDRWRRGGWRRHFRVPQPVAHSSRIAPCVKQLRLVCVWRV